MGGICSSNDEKSFTEADLELLKAVSKQDAAGVTAALHAGGDPYCRKPTLSSKSKGKYTGADATWGMSSVHIAAAQGSLDILDMLLNSCGEDNTQPLTWLADNGEEQAFRGTPLEHAVENLHPQVGLRLLSTGAPLPPVSRNLVQRAIRLFISTRYIQKAGSNIDSMVTFVTELIKSSKDELRDWRNPQQQTLLHELVSSAVLVQPSDKINGGSGPLASIITALLDVGVDPKVKDVNGLLAASLDTKEDLTAALSMLPSENDLGGKPEIIDNSNVTRQ